MIYVLNYIHDNRVTTQVYSAKGHLRASGALHLEYDALVCHYPHPLSCLYVCHVVRHGFPVVAVYGHSAVSACQYCLRHLAQTPNNGIHIAFSVVAVSVYDFQQYRSQQEDGDY